MAVDLTEPRAKVKRAEEHLNALYDEIGTFFEPYSESEFVHLAFDGVWHSVTFRPLFECFPLRWGLICGDFFHNLRAALDHLVWQLVLAGGNTPGKWNSFPIYSNPEHFVNDVRSRKKKRGPGPLEGIDPDGQAWAAIEGAQPYHSTHPRGDQLAVVNSLDIVDKHRTLVVNMLFPAEQDIRSLVRWHRDAEPLDFEIMSQPLTLKNETEILRFRFSEAWADPQVNMNNNFAVEATFGDDVVQVSEEMLWVLQSYISDFVDSFDHLF